MTPASIHFVTSADHVCAIAKPPAALRERDAGTLHQMVPACAAGETIVKRIQHVQ